MISQIKQRLNEVENKDLPETYCSTGHWRELENLVWCPLLAGFRNTERENDHFKTPMMEHFAKIFLS